MTILRTSRGTVTDKSGALSMSITAVQVQQYHRLVVAVAFDQGEGAPNTVAWGERELCQREVQQANGIGVAVFDMYRNSATAIEDLVITWNGTAPVAKAALASQVFGIEERDLLASNSSADDDTPSSGALQTTSTDDTIVFGFFASEGPQTDLPGVPSLGFLGGQRAGTSGGVADENVTIHETFSILALSADVRARKALVTARDHSIIMVSYRPQYSSAVTALVSVPDVDGVNSQAEADAIIEADVLTRFPPNFTVTII